MPAVVKAVAADSRSTENSNPAAVAALYESVNELPAEGISLLGALHKESQYGQIPLLVRRGGRAMRNKVPFRKQRGRGGR